MASVSIRKLGVSFGSLNVLRDLDLDVAEGEFIVLLGASGCGKSTLLNAIAGLLDINAGQVWIGGKNVTWEEPKDRGIGMVFQSYALYPRMTVEGNMSFGLKMARVPRDEIQRRVKFASELLQIESAPEAAAGAAFGRSAPTRRDRAGAGARRRRLPLRRAAVEPRRQAQDRASRRAEAAASAAGQGDDDLRNARSDRGADARRSHRCDARRRHPAARHAAQDLPSPGEPLRRRLRWLADDELPHRQGRRIRRAGVRGRGNQASAEGLPVEERLAAAWQRSRSAFDPSTSLSAATITSTPRRGR